MQQAVAHTGRHLLRVRHTHHGYGYSSWPLSKSGRIALGVVLGVVGVLLIVLLSLHRYRLRRRRIRHAVGHL